MKDSVLKAKVTRRVNSLTRSWNWRKGVYLNPKIVYFEDRTTTAGYCMGTKTIGFNLRYMRMDADKFVRLIVPHEVAHLFQHRLFPKDYHFHSKNWKMLCLEMGGDGKRFHDFPY